MIYNLRNKSPKINFEKGSGSGFYEVNKEFKIWCSTPYNELDFDFQLRFNPTELTIVSIDSNYEYTVKALNTGIFAIFLDVTSKDKKVLNRSNYLIANINIESVELDFGTDDGFLQFNILTGKN